MFKKFLLLVSFLGLFSHPKTSEAAQAERIIPFQIINPYAQTTYEDLRLKGQLHDHSTNSDGKLTPTEVAELYRDLGYDFLTITDHNNLTDYPNVPGITWIGQGVEETYSKHFAVYDVETRTGLLEIQKIVEKYSEQNKLISLSHPSWPLAPYKLSDIDNYKNFGMIEVFNGLLGKSDEIFWDEALKNRIVYGIAVDDFHWKGHENRGWVVVFAKENTKENILASLKTGNFYASNGNDLFIQLEGNTIYVISLSSSNFYFIGEGGKILKQQDNITYSKYVIDGTEKYIRVRSERISDGKVAWSQPLTIKKYNHFIPMISNEIDNSI